MRKKNEKLDDNDEQITSLMPSSTEKQRNQVACNTIIEENITQVCFSCKSISLTALKNPDEGICLKE